MTDLTDLTVTIINRETGRTVDSGAAASPDDASAFIKQVYRRNRAQIVMDACVQVALDDTCLEW